MCVSVYVCLQPPALKQHFFFFFAFGFFSVSSYISHLSTEFSSLGPHHLFRLWSPISFRVLFFFFPRFRYTQTLFSLSSKIHFFFLSFSFFFSYKTVKQSALSTCFYRVSARALHLFFFFCVCVCVCVQSLLSTTVLSTTFSLVFTFFLIFITF